MTSPEATGDELPALFQDLCLVVQQHLGVTGDDAEYWAERLMSHGLLNGYPYLVMDRPKDLRALKRVDQALLELKRALSEAAITDNTRGYFLEAIWFGEGVGNLWNEPDAAAEYAASEGPADMRAFERIIERNGVFRKALATTIAKVESSPFAKRSLSQLDVEAIGLVEGCRWVWWRCKGTHAPSRDLNQASPFARFLGDAFQACGIKSMPVSAFRAWARNQPESP